MTAADLKLALVKLVRDEEGATAVEYGLLAALLGAGIVLAVTALRNEIRSMFSSVSSTIKTAGQ